MEGYALQPAIAGDQLHLRREERAIVLIALRIQQMDARHIAFAAPGGFQPRQTADGEELGSHTTPL